MLRSINTLQPYLRVYPNAEQVFAEPVELYARHLLSLVSIDLSVINPNWTGWIHLVNTVEPEDEIVGKDTQPFHNYFLRPNWIAFHLNDNDRYELLGDLRFFYLENNGDSLPEFDDYSREILKEHYSLQHQGYAARKAQFYQHGTLLSLMSPTHPSEPSQTRPLPLLDQLGGGVRAGNWAGSYGGEAFPLDESDSNNVQPLMPDGTPFHFVASASSYNYCETGADSILLFFEPKSRTALLTFDWS